MKSLRRMELHGFEREYARMENLFDRIICAFVLLAIGFGAGLIIGGWL